MDEDNNIDRREEMLSRFRESLSLPVSERYFDEDELLDIFDYAGDVGDDYIRMEVLLFAAKYFPQSEQLTERKAIFYNQYSDDTIQKYLDDNPELTGLMWDILKVRQDIPQSIEDRHAILGEILEKYDTFDDEETVQFVDLISAFGAIDWAKEHLDHLRAKAENINMLLYEMAIMADNNQDKDLSIAMLDELTQQEPYNQYYWFFLAKQYGSTDDNEKSLNAIDYALAITPDDVSFLLFKAKLLYVMDKPTKDIGALLEKAHALSPENTEAVRLLSALYSENGDQDKGRDLLNEHLKAYPEHVMDIVPELILHHPDNIGELLDNFYMANPDNTQVLWISWAHHLTQNGYPEIAEEVIDTYERNSGSKIYAIFMIESMFKQQRFEDAILALNDYLDNNETEADFTTIVYIHLISMIRLQEYSKALTFCIFLEDKANISRFNEISQRLEYIGLMEIVRQIKDRLNITQDPADWDDYDPLKLWSKKES